MTVAQVLPIVTLYASIFCPDKQPLGSNVGKDYLQQTGPDTWEVKCCPQGWVFVHRRCSCIPVPGRSGYGYHPGVRMYGVRSSFSKGPRDLHLLPDVRGHVDMTATSGADLHHTINHNTYQLANFMKGHRNKENSNQRNALLLRQHRLKHQNNLQQNQLMQRNKVNSDISLKGKHIVHIRHSQLNGKRNVRVAKPRQGNHNNHHTRHSQPYGKRNLKIAKTRGKQDGQHRSGLGNNQNSNFNMKNNLGTENTVRIRQEQNSLGMNNKRFPENVGRQSMLGDTRSSLDRSQWLPGNSHSGSGSTSGLFGNGGTTSMGGNNMMGPFAETGFGAGGPSSINGNGNFQNSIGVDTTLGSTGSIGLDGRRLDGLSTVVGVNPAPNSRRIPNSVINGANLIDPLSSNGVGGQNVNGGGNIQANLVNDGSLGLNNDGSITGPFPTIAHLETNSNLNGGGALSGSLNNGGTFNDPLATVGNPSGGNALNIHSESIGFDPNLSNDGSISSASLLGGDTNLVSGNLGENSFQNLPGGDFSLNLNSQDPGFNPIQGANSFDQSSVFNLVGSMANKDISESSQNSGGVAGNGAGIDLSFLPRAEEFSALMRNGEPVSGFGGNTVPTENNMDTTNALQDVWSNSNTGSSSGLLNGQTPGTTESLIDQLLALNMANSMLESGSNVGNVLANNVNGGSMGLNENQIQTGTPANMALSSFEHSIPTDPSKMNNAMLLADRRILESPANPTPRLVTETIVLNTHDPLNTGHTTGRKVSVDITSSDTSIGGIINAGLLAEGARREGFAVDGLSKAIAAGNLLDTLGMETGRGGSKGLTDISVVNRGIVGIGLLDGSSNVRERMDGLSGGSGILHFNSLADSAAVSGGTTNVLFDGSLKKSPQLPVRRLDSLGSKSPINSKKTSNLSGFGVGNFQSVPKIVPRITNEQSAIETSINQILTISAAETAIAKAAKDSVSQKESAAPTASAGGRFVSQTGLELSTFHSNPDRTLTADVCLGCTMDGGLGYIRHPSRCDQFVVCYPDRTGLFKPRVQDCPYGQFWSNIDVTCKPSKDVNCEHDYCKKLKDRYQYSHSTNCVAYWQCQAGHSVIRCCPDGRTFVQGEGCVYSSVCADRCPVSSPSQFMWQVNCNKRPVSTDVTTFEKHVAAGWVSEKCSVGQIYKGEICDCIPAHMGNPTYSFKGVCKPEVFLPFDTDFKDYSGSNTFIRTENVTLSNGAACFDGTSVISMPKFANMDFGKSVFMRIRYKQMDLKIGTEALLYNGDCEEVPTLVVGTKPSGNSFSVKTNTGAFQTSWVPSSVDPADWREVTVTIRDGRLEGQSGINVRDIDVSGGIARSHCGIKLGWGKKFKSFVGCIDEVSIYRCIPNTSMAPDGTLQTAVVVK
ncbi:uncharacterized protein LOC117336434 [Pecten maximus]|uniref:uncharacterized protein LOC117336434 n=1 Tax=Pecten maximus TaxID=6579 RepID=UPI0014586556|nr:uncharacterized protein LOC117336434 [Pecten maximus]